MIPKWNPFSFAYDFVGRRLNFVLICNSEMKINSTDLANHRKNTKIGTNILNLCNAQRFKFHFTRCMFLKTIKLVQSVFHFAEGVITYTKEVIYLVNDNN